jgi:branched-chain amino acid transport system permease protein
MEGADRFSHRDFDSCAAIRAALTSRHLFGLPSSPHAQRRSFLPPSAFMDLALQLLFTGIGIGAVYALVALGFVLIFRATNVVNFAQGEFSMVAAYLMVVFAVDLGWPYWISFLVALAGMALLGAIFNLGVYYPLRHRTFLPVIIATIGASILLANSVLAIYGPQPQVLEGWFDTPGIQLGPVYLDSQYLLIIAVTVVLVIFNYWFFEHTMLGKKLQATSQDKEMASLLGISVSTMIMITFIYSAVLGGLAGILVAPILFVSIQMGSTIALKAFAATIIGGFGDVAGAIIGGLALGIIETFGAAYVSVPYKDGFAFLVLVLFLIFRPQGIFGERVAEKA